MIYCVRLKSMATGRAIVFPFNTKDFASTFLDPSKNARGYDGELLDLDKNTAKSLLHPFPFIPSSFRCGLAGQMHSFVEGQLGLRREHYDNVGQEQSINQFQSIKLEAVHGEKTRNEYESRGEAVEKKNLPKDPGDIIDIVKASDDVPFSDDDWKTRAEESGTECTTEQMPLKEEVTENNAPTECDEEDSTANKPQRNTNTQPEPTLSLSVKKAIKQDSSMELSDLTVKLNLRAMTSVLENRKYRPSIDELNVCGTVALLYGSYQSGDSTMTVNSSEVKGVYNYIDGTVKSCSHSENETSNWVDLTLFLSLEMSKTQHTLGCELTGHVKDITVAWCLSTPGFGIDLDWQVQEKLGKLINNNCSNKTENELAWCSVLVVVDEYRCAERDVPLIEVYQFNSSAIVKVVNFDF